MALDTNYVYRYRCSEYGGLICESNFRDFDPLMDAWTGTNSADCRAAERMGILVGERPRCSGRGRVSGGKDRFVSFMGLKENTMKQNAVLVGGLIIGGLVGKKMTKNSDKKMLNTAIGGIVGLAAGELINKYIK